ncbi:MAG: type IV pilin protein [Sarcina sp.]
MLKNLKTKKKGFTLIELVIVLAVLAIIALIAIPNFTKVRNESLEKADKQTAEQIEKITLMAIANDNVKPRSDGQNAKYNLKFDSTTKKLLLVEGVGVPSSNPGDNYFEMLKEVKKPQVNNKQAFRVEIDSNSNVTVYYDNENTTLSQ